MAVHIDRMVSDVSIQRESESPVGGSANSSADSYRQPAPSVAIEDRRRTAAEGFDD